MLSAENISRENSKEFSEKATRPASVFESFNNNLSHKNIPKNNKKLPNSHNNPVNKTINRSPPELTINHLDTVNVTQIVKISTGNHRSEIIERTKAR